MNPRTLGLQYPIAAAGQSGLPGTSSWRGSRCLLWPVQTLGACRSISLHPDGKQINSSKFMKQGPRKARRRRPPPSTASGECTILRRPRMHTPSPLGPHLVRRIEHAIAKRLDDGCFPHALVPQEHQLVLCKRSEGRWLPRCWSGRC